MSSLDIPLSGSSLTDKFGVFAVPSYRPGLSEPGFTSSLPALRHDQSNAATHRHRMGKMHRPAGSRGNASTAASRQGPNQHQGAVMHWWHRYYWLALNRVCRAAAEAWERD